MNETKVQPADAGIRLDRWFKRHQPMPHAMLEKQLRKGVIRVDGKKAKSSDRVEAGQVITMPKAELPELKKTPKVRAPIDEKVAKEMQALVLYRDEDMLIINKPAGLAVQGGTKQTTSVDDLLDALRFGAKERPKLVHRLDRDTSGVLVLARTTKAAGRLMKLFAYQKVHKTYWALVIGVPKPHQGTINLPMSKGGDAGREKMGIDQKNGLEAITDYSVKETLAQKYAWMELNPVTGRTHQLRVHMAAIGHPIVGDGKYGGSQSFIEGLDIAPQLHLHAREISLATYGGKTIRIEAKLPPHMQATWKELGLA